VSCMIVACARLARADELTDLEAKGEALAKDSEYTQAISAFKAADLLKPRASHACMIGLAYMRRELWPQAELFLALCEKRTAPGDQPPDWIDDAEHQLAAKLSAAQIPAVTIVVQPAGADAHLAVSSFAPDERFAPQTIHLSPGKHILEVTATGYRDQEKEITVRPAQPQTVVFALESVAPVPAPRIAPAGPSSRRSTIPWIVMGAGTALVGIAALYDLGALQPARDHLLHAESSAAYDAYTGDFSSARVATIGLFAAGALAITAGVALRYTVFADVTPHGGAIVVGWRR
jgi:hypothetical protein